MNIILCKSLKDKTLDDYSQLIRAEKIEFIFDDFYMGPDKTYLAHVINAEEYIEFHIPNLVYRIPYRIDEEYEYEYYMSLDVDQTPLSIDKKSGDIQMGTFVLPAKQINDKSLETLFDCYKEIYVFTIYVLDSMARIMQQAAQRNKMIKQRNGANKYKYSREHRISTANRKVWLFDDIVQYACDQYVEHKGTHKIECPCWEVRGHYRHYKNGNVVFIRSYKKGKQKDTAQPIGKEYIAESRKAVTQ